jgi:cytidine deaminase
MKKEYIDLYDRACEALKNAYAPYSGFSVGAAILTEDGNVFTGVNIENASFGATICAERTACVKAVSEGHRDLRACAVASSNGKAPMCGICRQFLSEFSPEMDIITGESRDDLECVKLSELLPDHFDAEKMK